MNENRYGENTKQSLSNNLLTFTKDGKDDKEITVRSKVCYKQHWTLD